MKLGVLFLTFCTVFAHDKIKKTVLSRAKRSAVGSLQIVTNHAQPIHADVKPEALGDHAEKTATDKPCSDSSVPSHIEPGVGFKVTPPEDAVTSYEMKSLRKSLPYIAPTTLEVTRSISRVVTILVLFVSALVEFYPTLYHWVFTIFRFINGK